MKILPHLSNSSKATSHRRRIKSKFIHKTNAHIWYIKPSMTWLMPISSSSFPISHFITLQPYWTTCQTSCCSLRQYKLMLLSQIRNSYLFFQIQVQGHLLWEASRVHFPTPLSSHIITTALRRFLLNWTETKQTNNKEQIIYTYKASEKGN